MGYKILKIVDKDNEDPWFPVRKGRWEVHDDDGKVLYRFKWKMKGDYAEWDDREWWTGPMEVRISSDGKYVEACYQTGIQHGIAFAGTLGQRVERLPLPPEETWNESE